MLQGHEVATLSNETMANEQKDMLKSPTNAVICEEHMDRTEMESG